MKLFGLNISITRTAPPVQKALALTPEEWLRGDDLSGGPVLSNAYEQVVWVYRAVNVLAEQVANIPFLFSAGERGRENLITAGPLVDFYDRPHPQINRFQYWELRLIWLMLRGECFRVPIYQNPDGTRALSTGTPISYTPAAAAAPLSERERGWGEGNFSGFQPTNPHTNATSHSITPSLHHSRPNGRSLKHVLILDPSRFQHIVEDNRLIGWRYNGLGHDSPMDSQVLLPEEVWFEKLPNPFDFWRGLSPLSIAALAAQTDFAAGSFMRGMIENNADTGLIVRTEQWLSDEQREQIRTALRERKRRAGEADRPVLLLGAAEVLKPELSSSDLQFLENRKFSRAEICAAFGVPEEIVTTTDHAKYDVMAGARLNFIENRIAPLCRRLEAEEDITVKALDPQASGWFDLDSLPILQEARRNRLAAARTGFEMGIPFNELNRVLDLGFRSLPWGDRAYIGSKLQQIGSEKAEVRSASEDANKGRSPNSESRARTPLRAEAPSSPTSDSLNTGSLTTAGADTHSLTDSLTHSLSTDPLITDSVAFNADPIVRAAHLFSSVRTYQLSTNDYQLLRKLRRFLFEQRTRALAALAQAGATRPLPPLLDPAAEPARLSAALEALLTEPGGGLSPELRAGILQLNGDSLAQLQGALAESQGAPETTSLLAARVRAHYNSLAESLPARVAALSPAGQSSPTSSTNQPQPPEL